jgi:competence protein ComEC
VISVGEGNSYGHPTAGTLATLERHGVPTVRTDEDGTVVIDVTAGAMSVDG